MLRVEILVVESVDSFFTTGMRKEGERLAFNPFFQGTVGAELSIREVSVGYIQGVSERGVVLQGYIAQSLLQVFIFIVILDDLICNFR